MLICAFRGWGRLERDERGQGCGIDQDVPVRPSTSLDTISSVPLPALSLA
jgi:hypothetical protein